MLCALVCGAALAGCEKRDPSESNAPQISDPVREEASARNLGNEGSDVYDPTSEALGIRLAAIDNAVGRWRRASNLREAQAAAEEARNLVVGPHGPFYGDGDRNGNIEGSTNIGLLPGQTGQAGLAKVTDSECVVRDVLGGSWEKPSHRWSQLEAAIKAWTPARNTMPTLQSHPQRIAGWATLALGSHQLEVARKFGEHAQIHSDVSQAAMKVCND